MEMFFQRKTQPCFIATLRFLIDWYNFEQLSTTLDKLSTSLYNSHTISDENNPKFISWRIIFQKKGDLEILRQSSSPTT